MASTVCVPFFVFRGHLRSRRALITIGFNLQATPFRKTQHWPSSPMPRQTHFLQTSPARITTPRRDQLRIWKKNSLECMWSWLIADSSSTYWFTVLDYTMFNPTQLFWAPRRVHRMTSISVLWRISVFSQIQQIASPRRTLRAAMTLSTTSLGPFQVISHLHETRKTMRIRLISTVGLARLRSPLPRISKLIPAVPSIEDVADYIIQ